MNNGHDTQLQTLFTDTSKEFDGTEFTTRVLDKTRNLKFRIVGGVVILATVLLVLTWIFSATIMEISEPFALLMTTSLIDLGEGSVAWLLSPVNNLGALLILGAKTLRVAWKRFSANA